MIDRHATPGADAAVRPLGHLKPKFRDDLQADLQHHAGEDSYLIEDRGRSKYYRIGIPEYTFATRLDGENSVEDALAATAAQLGPDALTEHEAAIVVTWLLDNDLARTDQSVRAGNLLRNRGRIRRQRMMARSNLIFLKLPLVNPDRFLEILTPAVRWLLGRTFFLLWLAVLATGAYQIFADWGRFVTSTQGLLDANNWLWLALVWTLLKILHELFHGLVCKRYGGDVYEAGMILILFAPIGYVDATSSWRFPHKWQRIHTAAAGMYIEFFIAGIAAWIWAQADSGTLESQLAHGTVIVASISTLLFNANPLMRFDGYYILADYLEVPNLYTLGQQYVRYLARRYLLGVAASPPNWPEQRRHVVRLYGVLSLVWRIVVVATLLIVASTLFSGAGLVIAVVSAIILIGVPLVRFLNYLVRGNEFERPRPLRFIGILTLVIGGAWLLGSSVHWSQSLSFPAIVDYRNATVVRNASPGFVREILVASGERVARGQLLVRLENPALEARLADARLRLVEAELRYRKSLVQGRLGQAQGQEERLLSLGEQIDEARRLVDDLRVVAPSDGYVEARDLDERLMTYLPVGERLLTVAASRAREVVFSVDQQGVQETRRRLDAPVMVIMNGHGGATVAGVLDRVSPTASDEVSQPALTALGGGPLTVRAAGAGGYRHTAPRFQGYVRIPEQVVAKLRVGETATVELRARRRSLLELASLKVWRWFEAVKASSERLSLGI